MWSPDDLQSFWQHEAALHKWQDVFASAFDTAQQYYNQHFDNYPVDEYLSLEEQEVGVGVRPDEYVGLLESGAVDEISHSFEDADLSANTSQEIDIADEEELSPEMLEYYKVTLAHREKRAREKLEEKLRKHENWLEEDEDEYIEADQIGIHGPIRKSTQAPNRVAEEEERIKEMKEKYGDKWEYINKIESKMNFEFESKVKELDAFLWPNIPLRFR